MDEPQPPVYRTRDYQSQSDNHPSQASLDTSEARERRKKRKLNQRDYSLGDVLWVIVAAVLFTVILLISIGVIIAIQF